MYVPPKAWVYKIPEEMPTRLGVLTELFVVAGTLDRAREFARLEARGFNFGDTVLIQGVGAVGMMFVIRARLQGAGAVIAVDASPHKLRMAREFGADHTIDTSSTTQAERVAMVKDLTEGRGADVVVECVGIPDVLPEGLEMTRRGGTYIETGNFVETGTVTIDVHRHIAAKNVLLIGNTNHAHTGYPAAIKMMMKTRETVPWDRFITGVHTVDNAAAAMEASFRPESLKEVIVP
jgi:L-iditol 2-dehydrogenase